MDENKVCSTQCIDFTLFVVGVNMPNIGKKKGCVVFQVWYNSTNAMGPITRKKTFQGLGELFKALGIMSIGKLFKEARGYNWSLSFYEC
jgi:hypothetical protein